MTLRLSASLVLALALGCGVRGIPKPPLQDPEPPPPAASDAAAESPDAGR